MTLITCPECSMQISSSAASCPHCGRPLAHRPGRDVQPIERRKKRYKLQMVLSVLTALAGMILMIAFCSATEADDQAGSAGMGIGMLMILLGGIWYMAVKLLAWWQHA